MLKERLQQKETINNLSRSLKKWKLTCVIERIYGRVYLFVAISIDYKHFHIVLAYQEQKETEIRAIY